MDRLVSNISLGQTFANLEYRLAWPSDTSHGPQIQNPAEHDTSRPASRPEDAASDTPHEQDPTPAYLSGITLCADMFVADVEGIKVCRPP